MINLIKNDINIIKMLCGLLPKTAVNINSTLIFFTASDNIIYVYGGDLFHIQFIYIINTTQKFDNINFAVVASNLLQIIKNNKNDINIEIQNNHLHWSNNKEITNLKIIESHNKIQQINTSQMMEILTEHFILAIKSINIKPNSMSSKCYLHIQNNQANFIIIDSGRMTISNSIVPIQNNINSLFVIINYEALLLITNILISDRIRIFIHNNMIIIKNENIELRMNITKANYINYTKYISLLTNFIELNTNDLQNATKFLMTLNKTLTEIVTIQQINTEIMLECYNPNVGSRKTVLKIYNGILSRSIKLNLNWLDNAIKTITSDNCKIFYGNNTVDPIIVASFNDSSAMKNEQSSTSTLFSNLHVLAPIITK